MKMFTKYSLIAKLKLIKGSMNSKMTELGITTQVFITQYICCRSICSLDQFVQLFSNFNFI